MFYRKSQQGFTLIEMLVSLALFTIVVTMSVGTLLILVDANARAQNTHLVVTNLTFALDSMTREIRTAFNWSCGDSGNVEPTVPIRTVVSPCLVPGNYISIVESVDRLTANYASERVTYWYDNDYWTSRSGIEGHGAILRKLGADTGDGPWTPLTAEEIVIEEMGFSVTGTARYGDGDTEQPRATIYIKGRAGVVDTTTKEFTVQTTVTQRLFDTL
ncbi:MAG: prepilin-type N-terminal cleavage/methylation domain-containing protein [Candidatus Azotimanducaceae bacterium]|jgi:prepilin-type N-terminal cleavage/methylation domain-containing protein